MVRFALALAYLALQVVAMVHGRIDPGAHFHWAPFDVLHEYRISVEIDGQSLTGSQISERYGERAEGIEPHAIEHLVAIVRQYEETYGRDDQAQVVIRYQINGREVREWHWPQQ